MLTLAAVLSGADEVIEAVIAYAASVFPDRYLHLGGDEMALTDWTSDPKIAAYLKRQHPVSAETVGLGR